MGKRGPAPTPTAILQLSNTWRSKEREKINEPQPAASLPIEPPAWLRERAVEFWRNLVPILSDMGVMTGADCDALAMYCQTLAKLEEYEKLIEEQGSVYYLYDKFGDIRAIRTRPEATMAKEMTSMASRLGQQFGLTPSSRAHLHVDSPGSKKTDKLQFFRHTAAKEA